MRSATLRAVVAAELVKIRSLRSTAWTMLAFLVLAIGIGYLSCRGIHGFYNELSPESQRAYDPMCPILFSITWAQYPMVVFAVITVTGEYSTGMIRISMAAVPRRGVSYFGKLFAVVVVAFGASVVTVASLFAVAQATLGSRGASMGDAGTSLALLGACSYLVLISLFVMGMAVVLRSGVAVLTILLPLMFIGSQASVNAPGLGTALKYLPSQAGMVLYHVVGDVGEPWLGPGYGPWTALGALLAWSVAGVTAGYLVFRRRDA